MARTGAPVNEKSKKLRNPSFLRPGKFHETASPDYGLKLASLTYEPRGDFVVNLISCIYEEHSSASLRRVHLVQQLRIRAVCIRKQKLKVKGLHLTINTRRGFSAALWFAAHFSEYTRLLNA